MSRAGCYFVHDWGIILLYRVVAQGLAYMSGGHGVGGSNPPNPI